MDFAAAVAAPASFASSASFPIAASPADWQGAVAGLLDELSNVQDELFDVLAAKRQRLMASDLTAMDELQAREESVCERLHECQQRRAVLLAEAQRQGLPSDSVTELAGAVAPPAANLGKQVKDVALNMRLLQHQSLTNWVLAQRSLLHVSQLLEIIATGGRLQPTYGDRQSPLNRGSLVDQEA